MNVSQHPTSALLQQFALGQIDEGLLQEIAEHVEHCDECSSIVSQIPNDQLLGKLNDLGVEAVPDQPTPNQIPELLKKHPRYEVIKELGHGGMGAVFLARHRVMNRMVALKLIRPDLTRNDRIVDRFLKEVRVSGQHSHPNIVTAFDAEHDQHSLFLVMEYIEGANLHQLVKKNGHLSIRQACHFALQVAQGLEHASRRGLIHRDIKPKNLIVTRNGRVKILDFGLATLLEIENSKETQELTETGVVLGSPDFISPEQASDAKRADTRSDIYSLGCTLFFMLTGRVPFKYDSLAEKIGAHLHVDPPDPQSIRADIPPQLSQFVLQMLAKSVDDRPQSYADVIEFLRPFAKQKDPPAVQPAIAQSGSEGATVAAHVADDTISQSLGDSVANPPTAPPVSFPYVAPQITKAPKTASGSFFTKQRPLLLSLAAMLLVVFAFLFWFFWSDGNPNPSPSNATQLASNAKVLVVVPYNNYWPPDYDGVITEMEKNGIGFEVASNRAGTAIPSNETGSVHNAVVNRLLTGDEADEFDAVIFIGAYPVSDMVFVNQSESHAEARKLIRQFLSKKKVVAAVCGGVAPICDAGVLGNRRVGFSQYVPQRLKDDAAINWVYDQNERVVVDEGIGTIITGQRDKDAAAVARQVIAKLASESSKD